VGRGFSFPFDYYYYYYYYSPFALTPFFRRFFRAHLQKNSFSIATMANVFVTRDTLVLPASFSPVPLIARVMATVSMVRAIVVLAGLGLIVRKRFVLLVVLATGNASTGLVCAIPTIRASIAD
jgi:hypothetical protein